jgi:hypothetical protein
VGTGSPRRPGLAKTLEQLRRLREQATRRYATNVARRRLEDLVREARHDARAKSICAGQFAERRRFRTDSELRAQRDEWERLWESAQRLKRK